MHSLKIISDKMIVIQKVSKNWKICKFSILSMICWDAWMSQLHMMWVMIHDDGMVLELVDSAPRLGGTGTKGSHVEGIGLMNDDRNKN